MSQAATLAPRLAATMAARAAQAEQNRQRAPIAAAFVTEFREVFGAVEVLYVREGDFVKGRPDDAEGVVPCLDYVRDVPKKGRRL